MNRSHLPTAKWETIRRRAELLRAIRSFFDARGFTEVQTPILSRDIVVDAHLEPFSLPSDYGTLFLQTSPEFAMKRLLASGAEAIYQICHAFRNGEAGAEHNPEFAMLEWYQARTTYRDQMLLTEQLVREVVGSNLGLSHTDFPQISYDDACERALGSRVLQKTPQQLCQLAAEQKIELPASTNTGDRDELLNLLLAERVEPTLGVRAPEFLYDYPDTQSALARVRHDEPPVAERFELYYLGIELCNGYQELTDAAELAERNRQQNGIRRQAGLAELPEDSHLLDAMRQGLPECSGVALGVDRLLMVALGLDHIGEVWSFPIDRA